MEKLSPDFAENFVTIFDVFAFVRRWYRPITVITVGIVALAGVYLTLNKPFFATELSYRAPPSQTQTLREPKAIEQAFISMFRQPYLAKGFAERFFATLAADSSSSGKAANDYFLSVFRPYVVKAGSGIGDQFASPIPGVSGLAVYLSTVLPGRIMSGGPLPKNSFAINLQSFGPEVYHVSTRFQPKGLLPAVVPAFAAGLNWAISQYNQQQLKARQEDKRLLTERTKAEYDALTRRYLPVLRRYETERARLLTSYDAIILKLEALEKVAGIQGTPARKRTPPPAVDATREPIEVGPDELHELAGRIARLQAQSGQAKEAAGLIEELGEAETIRAMLANQIENEIRPFSPQFQSLSKALADAAKPIATEDFALAPALPKDEVLFSTEDEILPMSPLFMPLAVCAGLFVALFAAILLQFRLGLEPRGLREGRGAT